MTEEQIGYYQNDGSPIKNEFEHKYIIFKLKNEHLSIPLIFVQEVLDINKIRRVPLLDNKLLGLFILRGKVISILNFEKCLFRNNPENYTQSDNSIKKVIVLNSTDEKYGIFVDEIDDIVELHDGDFENIPSAVQTKLDINDISNIAVFQKKIIKVLDIKNILKQNLNIRLEVAKINQNLPNKPQSSANLPKRSEDSIEYELTLDLDQKDALKEICNIASGNAVIALSKLIKSKQKVDMTIEDLFIKQLANFDKNGFELDEQVIGIRAIIKNDLDAAIFITFPLKQFYYLLNLIKDITNLPKEITSLDGLSDEIQSAIIEVGNIIISHYCKGISDFLQINLMHNVPEIALDDYGALIDGELASIARYSDNAIVLQTKINIKQKAIDGQIFFIPYNNSIQKFVNWLNVDNIMNALDKNSTENPNNASSEEEIFSNVSSQQSFQMEDEDKKKMKIDDLDLDVFRELGNIGAGNAGNALSQMLNKKVFLEIPPARVLTLTDLVNTYGDNKMSLGYIGTTSGFFESNLLLSLSSEHIENLLQIVLEYKEPKKLSSPSDLSSNEKSAVIELLNILMGHYIASIGDFLRIMIDPPEYQFFFKNTKTLFKQLKSSIKGTDIKAIIIETSINVADSDPIKGDFILLLDPKTVHKVLKRISEIW